MLERAACAATDALYQRFLNAMYFCHVFLLPDPHYAFVSGFAARCYAECNRLRFTDRLRTSKRDADKDNVRSNEQTNGTTNSRIGNPINLAEWCAVNAAYPGSFRWTTLVRSRNEVVLNAPA